MSRPAETRDPLRDSTAVFCFMLQRLIRMLTQGLNVMLTQGLNVMGCCAREAQTQCMRPLVAAGMGARYEKPSALA